MKRTTNPGEPGLRQTLRDATQADHQRVDGLGGGFLLDTLGGYASFLRAHASVVPALEDLIAAHGPRPPQWRQRCRSAALAEDLRLLDTTMPATAPVAQLASMAHRAGALYVLEGSRMGGRILARRVQSTLPGAPVAYLSHPGKPSAWTQFVSWLDDLNLENEQGRSNAIDGARLTFAAFADAFQRERSVCP